MGIGLKRSEWSGENITLPGESRSNLGFGPEKFPVPRVLFDPLIYTYTLFVKFSKNRPKTDLFLTKSLLTDQSLLKQTELGTLQLICEYLTL